MNKKGTTKMVEIVLVIIILIVAVCFILYLIPKGIIPILSGLFSSGDSNKNCLAGTICHCPVAARFCNGTEGETLPTLGRGESWDQIYPPLGSWSDCPDRCFRRCPPAGCGD
jgi:hypothetical protein